MTEKQRTSQIATVVADLIETLMLWNGQASAGLDVKALAGLRDELRSELAASSASIADTAGAKQQLSNLLARIHRDGGHYEAEHGTGKAVDDADLIVAKLNAAADAAQKPIAWINADANYCTKDAIAAQHVEGLIPVFAAPPAPSVADAPCAVCKDNECFVDGGGDDCKMKKDADALQAKRFRMAVRGGWIREIDVQVIDYEIAKESGND